MDKLEDLVTVLLLPAFFAFTGLRTQIGLVAGADQWLVCGVIVVVLLIAARRFLAVSRRFSIGPVVVPNRRP